MRKVRPTTKTGKQKQTQLEGKKPNQNGEGKTGIKTKSLSLEDVFPDDVDPGELPLAGGLCDVACGEHDDNFSASAHLLEQDSVNSAIFEARKTSLYYRVEKPAVYRPPLIVQFFGFAFEAGTGTPQSGARTMVHQKGHKKALRNPQIIMRCR